MSDNVWQLWENTLNTLNTAIKRQLRAYLLHTSPKIFFTHPVPSLTSPTIMFLHRSFVSNGNFLMFYDKSLETTFIVNHSIIQGVPYQHDNLPGANSTAKNRERSSCKWNEHTFIIRWESSWNFPRRHLQDTFSISEWLNNLGDNPTGNFSYRVRLPEKFIYIFGNKPAATLFKDIPFHNKSEI